LYFFLSLKNITAAAGRREVLFSRERSLHLAIVSGPTLNYNGEAVVEITL
jgi:hypothetical protein